MSFPDIVRYSLVSMSQVQYHTMIVSAVMVMLLSVGLFVITCWLSSELGSLSINLWVVVTMMALVQDIVLLEIVTIFIRAIAIPSYGMNAFYQLVEFLETRAKIVLTRSTGGHMGTANALVQHLNPAVRVARFYPQYPICRMLMNLSDTDLPLQKASPLFAADRFMNFYENTKAVCMKCLLHVVYVPLYMQDFLLRVYCILLLQLMMWSISWLYTVNYISLVLVTVVAAGCIFAIPMVCIFLDWNRRCVTEDAVVDQEMVGMKHNKIVPTSLVDEILRQKDEAKLNTFDGVNTILGDYFVPASPQQRSAGSIHRLQ